MGKSSAADLLAYHIDSWRNLMTGLGDATRDKRYGAKFEASETLDDATLIALFNGDDMAARAVELVVVDALKKGFDFTAGDADDAGDAKEEVDEVKKLLDKLGARQKLREAATWGRLFGQGAILIGANDGKLPSQPLDLDKIKSFDFLTVLDKRDFRVEQNYGDPLKPSYGRPELYRIIAQSVPQSNIVVMPTLIHESRFIMFEGQLTDRRTRLARQNVSLSSLQRLYEVLRDVNSNWASTAHLMTDANLGILKIKGFLKLLASKDRSEFQTRLSLMDMAKSAVRSIVMDADLESYERSATSFAGYPEILDRSWQRLAAAAEMPVTKLMGMSPAGMNATGESDERMWGATVESYQFNTLKDPVEMLGRIAARALGMPQDKADALCVSFPPYRQLTPLEEADRRLKVQQTDSGYITSGVWLAEEVAVARVKGGSYSADPPIVDLELRKRVLDKELDSYEANAGKPEAPPNGTSGQLEAARKGGQANDLGTGGGSVDPADDVYQGDRRDQFSPSEARDKDGKWTGGGASSHEAARKADMERHSTPAADVEHYHGTDAKNVPSILAHGIKPTDRSLGPKTAWASTSQNLAASYGAGAAARNGSDKYAIVVLKSGEKAGLKSLHGDKSAAYSTETIKPEHIDRVEIHNVNEKPGDKPVEVIHPKGAEPKFNARDVVHQAIKNGGFTVDLAGKAAPSDGYGVSPYPEHERKIKGVMTAAALKQYRNDKADFVKADPTRKIGGWYNVKDDTWYLDVSHVVKDRDAAMKLAKEHKQLAIYNFKTGESEDVK